MSSLQFLIAFAVSYSKKSETCAILFHMLLMTVVLVYVRDRKPKKTGAINVGCCLWTSLAIFFHATCTEHG